MWRSGLKTKIPSAGEGEEEAKKQHRRHAKYDIMLLGGGRREWQVARGSGGAWKQYGGPRKYVHSRQKPS